MNAKRNLFGPIALVLACAALAGPSATTPAVAGTLGTTYYTCTVNIASGTNDCTDNIITATTTSGIYRVLRANLAAGYQRLDVFVNVCAPTNWWIHFGDSPTDNGFGGDGATTRHDAEAYLLGSQFQMYTMDNPRGNSWPSYRSEAVTATSGCYRVQWAIYESRVMFDDDSNPADAFRVDVTSSRGFERSPYAEADSEDPTGADSNLWYVGLNRTVGSAGRVGTGVNKACFVLSTTTTPSAAVLSALCPDAPPGGGGGKVPIEIE